MGTWARAGAVLLTALATAYILQAGDSMAATASAPPELMVGDFEDLAPSAVQESFLSNLEVVPVGRQNITMPILTFHYVRQPPPMNSDLMGFKLSVSPGDFAAQMDWLSANRFHPVDFSDLRAYFAGKRPLPARPVVITLDDGYADLYTTAYPILKAHGFKAVAYIVSSFVGRDGYVTEDQLRQMDSNGIEIASHTVHHPNLARSSGGSVFRELTESKRWLESVVGHPVLDFAYPSGQFTPSVAWAVQAAGYNSAVTTYSSTNHSLADRYMWARVRIGGGESLEDFVHDLGPVMPSITVRVADVETVIEPKPVKPPFAAREA